MMSESPNLTIVIPAYNEEQTIGEDIDVIVEAMETTNHVCGIMVVDDGLFENWLSNLCLGQNVGKYEKGIYEKG